MPELQTYENIDYSKEKLPLDTYDGCRFIRCNFAGVHLSNQNFLECVFEECNLSNTYVKSSSFKDVTFDHCKIIGVLFGECNPFLLEFKFLNSQVNMCSFYALNLKKICFDHCIVQETDFTEADLTGAIFKNCDLTDSHFERSILLNADFSTAENYSFIPEINKLKGAKFSADGLRGLVLHHGIKVV